VVLEDPDTGSWHFNPPAAAAERLIELILEAFTLNWSLSRSSSLICPAIKWLI
jgi:hypothetical protein